jgi:hypothetical protein
MCIRRTQKLIRGGPSNLHHHWIQSAVLSSAWFYPPLPRRWIAAAEYDRKDHDQLTFDAVVYDVRKAADAEGPYSISIDAYPFRISLNPSEGLGALDNEVRAEPSGPFVVPPAPGIEIIDDFGAIPKYELHRPSRRRSRTSSHVSNCSGALS